MTDKQHLLLANNFHPETVLKLESLYHCHQFWSRSEAEQDELLQRLSNKCRAVASASWRCDERIYELPGLELIACFGVGVDGIDFTKTRARGIQVSNTPDVLNDAVADIAIALILATSRELINADKFVRSGQWQQGRFPLGRGLAGKTLGIAGLGRIGEEIALRAQTFKLKIAYHNRSRKDCSYQYCDSLAQLAEKSDILLCMLPGGESTYQLMNADIFAQLGPTGVFINVGRGSSVNEADLADALQSGTIAAAGLDVYANEPDVPRRFCELDNTVLLPHIGSATVETRLAMGQLVIDNLQALFNGQPLLTAVP